MTHRISITCVTCGLWIVPQPQPQPAGRSMHSLTTTPSSHSMCTARRTHGMSTTRAMCTIRTLHPMRRNQLVHHWQDTHHTPCVSYASCVTCRPTLPSGSCLPCLSGNSFMLCIDRKHVACISATCFKQRVDQQRCIQAFSAFHGSGDSFLGIAQMFYMPARMLHGCQKCCTTPQSSQRWSGGCNMCLVPQYLFGTASHWQLAIPLKSRAQPFSKCASRQMRSCDIIVAVDLSSCFLFKLCVKHVASVYCKVNRQIPGGSSALVIVPPPHVLWRTICSFVVLSAFLFIEGWAFDRIKAGVRSQLWRLRSLLAALLFGYKRSFILSFNLSTSYRFYCRTRRQLYRSVGLTRVTCPVLEGGVQLVVGVFC